MPELKKLFSAAQNKVAAKTKFIKWRMLYNTMHKIDTAGDDMNIFAAIWHANVLARLVTLRDNPARIKFARELEADFFEAIYQTNNELFMYNYDITDTKHRKQFLSDVITRVHKNKSAGRPEIADYLHDVKFLPPHKKRFAEYNLEKNIVFYPPALQRTSLARFMKAPLHEYIHLLQRTYNSTLSETALKLEIEYPVLNMFVPRKRRLKEQEALLLANKKTDNIVDRFLDFLAAKANADDKHFN
jgi:hypothetical protein